MTDETGTRHASDPGPGVRSGAYRLDLATRTWWWSDEVYAIHGFAPHQVVPTTELVLAHQHPDDRDLLAGSLERSARTGEPFSSVHRIRDAAGREQLVGIIGEGRARDADGHPVVLDGYVTELTRVVGDRAQATATAAIAAAARSRAVIDQACGAVALAAHTDPETAFARLRVASNDANVPVRTLAAAIVGALPDLGGDATRLTRFLETLLAPAHRAA